MALLLSCLEVCVCSMWSRAVFEIRPDFLHPVPSMGPQSQNIRPPSCLMDAHSMAMKNGHQQESWDIREKCVHSSGRLSPFKLLFCNMKHVGASVEELHQSTADRVDNNDRNVETCQCHATRQHASVHPRSFSPSVAVSKSMLSVSPSYMIRKKNTFFFEFKSDWFSLDQVI